MVKIISPLPFLTHIPDWRTQNRIQYDWNTLWVLICLSLLAAPTSILALCHWLEDHQEWLKQTLEIERLPSQATLYRFFWALEQHQGLFETALLDWTASHFPAVHERVHLAVDGKTLKGSRRVRQGEPALAFCSFYIHALSLACLQVPLDGTEEPRCAARQLEKLQALFGERWLLTADAGYTDAPFAQAVTAQGGAYFLALKKNMKVVLEYAQFAFEFPAADVTHDTEHRSGEIWTRTLCTQNVLPDEVLAAFPTAKTLIRRTHRIRRHDGEVVVEQRYAVSSLAASATEFENIWRRHWAIENCSHHRRDTLFGEDACRSRRACGVLAALRNVALTLLSSVSPQVVRQARRLRIQPRLALPLLGLT